MHIFQWLHVFELTTCQRLPKKKNEKQMKRKVTTTKKNYDNTIISKLHVNNLNRSIRLTYSLRVCLLRQNQAKYTHSVCTNVYFLLSARAASKQRQNFYENIPQATFYLVIHQIKGREEKSCQIFLPKAIVFANTSFRHVPCQCVSVSIYVYKIHWKKTKLFQS